MCITEVLLCLICFPNILSFGCKHDDNLVIFLNFPLGRATSNKFRPGESTGADALLQAIAVLEAQPVTAVEEVENVADDVDTLGENRHVEIAVKSHHADSEKDSFPYETP